MIVFAGISALPVTPELPCCEAGRLPRVGTGCTAGRPQVRCSCEQFCEVLYLADGTVGAGGYEGFEYLAEPAEALRVV